MDLSEENFKAHQSKIEQLRIKIDKLETSQFLIESERMKKNAYIEQLKQENRELRKELLPLKAKIEELEDQIEQDIINDIEASEYD